MKTRTKTTMGLMLVALTGYGAWELYKKYNKDMMCRIENTFRKMPSEIEKSLDDMM